MFGNIGGPQLLVILLVALVVLGPEKLPEAVRAAGKMVRQVRNVSAGFQKEMRDAMDMVDMDPEPPAAKASGAGLHPGLGSGPALPPLTEVTDTDAAVIETTSVEPTAIGAVPGEAPVNGAAAHGGADAAAAVAAGAASAAPTDTGSNASASSAAVAGDVPGTNGSSTPTSGVVDDAHDDTLRFDGPASSFS